MNSIYYSPEAATQGILLAQRESHYTPVALYSKAWGIIKDTFYDQQFNGQDWKSWEHRYDGKLHSKDDAIKAINTMLSSLEEPGTVLLTEDDFTDAARRVMAHVFGVGIAVEYSNDKKVLVTSYPQTPAAFVGIQSGEELSEIDRKTIKGQSLDEIVKRLRGEKGTNVVVGIKRSGAVRQFSLTRGEFQPKSVLFYELPEQLAYIRIAKTDTTQFNKELSDALLKATSTKGVILDLRDNKGGFYSNDIEVANKFLSSGTIVRTVDADGYESKTVATPGSKYLGQLVLLTNEHTGGSTQVIAAALKDNGRAKVVGEKTAGGKPIIRVISNLGDGMGMMVAIARWLPPKSVSYDGVEPDVKVSPGKEELTKAWWNHAYVLNPASIRDVQLLSALSLIKKDLEGKAK